MAWLSQDKMPVRPRGRPRTCEPTAEDLAKLRAVYLQTNAGRDKGSKYMAARVLARRGELSPDVARAILRQGTKSLPKSLRDQMHVPLDVIRHQRAPKNARLGGIYVPGRLRMTRDEDGLIRRLRPGERQSWDDATINFGVVVPWPWGGDRCSDKFGVRLVRAQLLVCIDDATDYCPGFSYVVRAEQSYRAEDTVAAQFRLWRDVYAPERVMLEGGSWQSERALAWMQAAGVIIDDATGRPHLKLVENWLNRLWTLLSLLPGNVGRYRGEMERETKLYLRCRAGRDDPRPHFPALGPALAAIDAAITELDTTPVESPKYGRWVPAERHAEGLADRPRPKLDPALAIYAAPVVERRQVRRNMVRITCDGPFGRFPYHFADPALVEVEGADVMVYFDPWDSPLRATIAMARDWHGRKAGQIICEALCLDDAPAVMAALDGLRVDVLDQEARAVEMRRRIAQAIRREYRAIRQEGGWVLATDLRGADGSVLRVDSGAGVPDGATAATAPAAPDPQALRRAAREARRAEVDLAELERFEAANAVPGFGP